MDVHTAVAADAGSKLKEYFSILATGEALFVTFYSNVVANHQALGLAGAELNAIKAILVEEQIHYHFAVANGGTPATTHFSFPHGAKTFERRALFLQTQQLSEELTNGALLAWIKDMASMGQPRLAQIGGQLMQVEGGHRVVGRVLLNAEPWDDWAFVKSAPNRDPPGFSAYCFDYAGNFGAYVGPDRRRSGPTCPPEIALLFQRFTREWPGSHFNANSQVTTSLHRKCGRTAVWTRNWIAK